MFIRVLICLLLSLAATAQVYVKELDRGVIETRLAGSSVKNAERKEILKKWFEESGCPKVAEQPVKHELLPNLICTLPGATDRVIIVGAHFDCVDAGEGVADNWSGASLLPSLLQSLAERPRQHTYIFIAFTSEEKGLLGSEYYAKTMTKEERARVDAMVNMDTLGLSPTKLWLNHADKQLVQLALKVASAMKMPIAAVNFEQVGSTDSDSFLFKKIPALTIHSVTPQTYRILHSTDDRLRAINLDDYYSTYRFTAVYLGYLDSKLGATPAAP